MGLLSAAMNPQVLPQPMGGGRPLLTPQMDPRTPGFGPGAPRIPFMRAPGSGATSDYEQQLYQRGVQSPTGPVADPTQSGGMLGAFANNPQFQSYLQAMMQGQGPGMQMPQMMAPQMRMQTMPMQQRRGAFGGAGGY